MRKEGSSGMSISRSARSVDSESQVETRDHVVHFYSREQELDAGVTGYLSDALDIGGSAVVVATPRHRANFEAGLATLGVDVQALREASRIVLLDAREILESLLVGGRPDPGRFDEIVGGVIRDAVGRGRPVHVYGEMVNLLWEADEVSQTLELEALWNELGKTLPFSLLCGYRVDAAVSPGYRETDLDSVCSAHTAVVNPPIELRAGRVQETTRRGTPVQ